ncbi:Pantothenate transporter liz1 [Colletotrichum viniferum]|nr:Pantothenate transporter liz1 [Colletotrichum viniferum]
MSSVPPNIEDGSSSTLLPSCRLSELAIGNFPPSATRSLDDDREKNWYNPLPGETPGVKAQLVRLSATAQIYVLRFFIGLAESTFYPGMQYIIGSWYRKDELAKRSCLFHAMGNVGSMVSGYLMAGAHNLDGVHGYHGWQWLFITNTIVSLPIAISGFFILPELPEITKAYWHIWTLVILYIVFNNGNGGNSQPAFPLWLKSEGYSLCEVNIYPTITEVVSIITTLIYAWTSDSLFRGPCWPAIVFSGLVKIIAYVPLTIWNAPNSLKWACFILCGFGGEISGLTFAWAHEICSDDNEERALVTGAMNQMAYVFQAWLPLVIWQQVEAPAYPKGYPSMVALSIVLIGIAFVIRFLHKREIRLKGALGPNPA